jgi:hypothetical protein
MNNDLYQKIDRSWFFIASKEAASTCTINLQLLLITIAPKLQGLLDGLIHQLKWIEMGRSLSCLEIDRWSHMNSERARFLQLTNCIATIYTYSGGSFSYSSIRARRPAAYLPWRFLQGG